VFYVVSGFMWIKTPKMVKAPHGEEPSRQNEITYFCAFTESVTLAIIPS
jgi:hypothetical protein